MKDKNKENYNNEAIKYQKDLILDENFDKSKIKKISLFSLIKFCTKMLFYEKSLYIFILIITLFTFGVALFIPFATSSSLVVIVFDFYVLIYISSFLFLLLLRMCQFYFSRKVEDKTVFIVLSNHVSRFKYFITQIVIILFIAWLNIFFSWILINLFYNIFNVFQESEVILRKTTSFLVFSFLITFFLVCLIIFLSVFSNNQTTLVITTLILSFSFIANLPYQFIRAKEKSDVISFSSFGQEQSYRVSNIYESFDFINYVYNNKIKYNYLSNSLANFFINSSIAKDNFSRFDQNGNPNDSVMLRYNYWKSLGLIEEFEDNKNYSLENIQVNNFPGVADFSNNEIWNNNDYYNISFHFKNNFISIDQLKTLINQTNDIDKKNILLDFYNLNQQLIKDIYNFQLDKADLFDDFIKMAFNSNQNLNTSYICSTKNSSNCADFKSSYLISIYKKELLNDLYNGNESATYFALKPNQEQVKKLIKEDLYLPTMLTARVIENYFIDPISTFKTVTNLKVLKSNANWVEFTNRRQLFNIFTYLSPFYSVWTNYTYYSGFSWKDLWFSPYSTSSLNLYDQENLLLPYLVYDLKLDENGIIYNDVYDKKTEPFIFIIIIFIICSSCLVASAFKYNVIDLA
ncbi:hypothetical protein [Spiroplasma turonicum]|uniref:Transmembrane protein n=1 Tax=Spiroplasma turonicum TaxID=216946 RepID=A0A0K1P5I2_9MOLU|nr:hypothetical protein [Spiroplasma turonicum]AKU79548.1 transmembrane protein [Spiroplasma turonicum]ALX70571.1 ABC transporter permease [Spiroplasma turonicum]